MKSILKPLAISACYCLFFSPITKAQSDTTGIAQPEITVAHPGPGAFNIKPAYFTYATKDHNLHALNGSYTIKYTDPFSFNYDKLISKPEQKYNFLYSVMRGSAAGLPSLSNNKYSDYFIISSPSKAIGFTMGFLTGGIIGGLLSKKYYTYGVPSPFNDFLVSFK